MIYLITGMPGNGKTLYAVDFIRKAVDKGRKVYSDIKGLTLPGVEPAPDDWRTLEDGALVVYDEAHKRFPSFKGKGRSPLKVVQDMDEHRHRGFDLMFITQWPDKIDGELFRLVGTHWHLNRAFGLQSASLCAFTRGVLNPYSNLARKGADESIWSYPTDLYKVYKSSSLHTDAHKFKLPAKIRNALISAPLILLVLWGMYEFLGRSMAPKGEAERSEAETTPRAGANSAPMSTSSSSLTTSTVPTGGGEVPVLPVVPQIAGCVSSERGCRCFTSDGLQIDQTQYQCQRMLEKPLPINVYHQYAAAATASGPAQERTQPVEASAGTIVGDASGQRGDVFARNPARTISSYTPGTTTL